MSERLDAEVATLRARAEKAKAHPLLPREAKIAIAGLVDCMALMADELRFLRSDLTQLSTYRRGPPPASERPH